MFRLNLYTFFREKTVRETSMHTHETYVLERETSIPIRAIRIRTMLNRMFRVFVGLFRGCSKLFEIFTCCALSRWNEREQQPRVEKFLVGSNPLVSSEAYE